MTDTPCIIAPTILKLNPNARLLSYKVRDDITAPAQYYPLPLPLGDHIASKYSKDDTPKLHGQIDRSILVYGTRVGLTILYPRRTRLREPEPESPDLEAEDSDRESYPEIPDSESDRGEWVRIVYENEEDEALFNSRLDDLGLNSVEYNTKYEYSSELDDSCATRNTRFPCAYSIEFHNPVVEIAFPKLSLSTDGEPLAQRLYISVTTQDGMIRLVAIPFRVPPPGVSSTKNLSKEFPVDIITLKGPNTPGETEHQVWYIIVGSMGFYGQVCIWKIRILGNGQLGQSSKFAFNIQNFCTGEITTNLRSIKNSVRFDDSPNTVAFHIAQKLNGTVSVVHLNPFTGAIEHMTTMCAPVLKGATVLQNLGERILPIPLAKERILAIDLLFCRDPPSGLVYQLWAILENGEYGYWDLKKAGPMFQQQGFFQSSTPPNGRRHSASIIVTLRRLDDGTTKPVCIARFNRTIQCSGTAKDFRYKLGEILSHHSNTLSRSPFVNVDDTQRLVMTEMFRGFMILEYNVSSDSSETYFHKNGRESTVPDSPWKRAVEGRKKIDRNRLRGEREIEQLSRMLHNQQFSRDNSENIQSEDQNQEEKYWPFVGKYRLYPSALSHP
ncbi:hypothetical protein H072_5321 [Dactylellina haptotyla CBS 200.50]|uniref:Uncharacterized protein n=1 Tax=Dactylellina haptotyla (strain CBS 200.50) TaxID=1284197 RepID=S8AI48_DACHA|nr:hypothetical protein H072_5321 [Dactylellina haptotyla CBS 200.50]